MENNQTLLTPLIEGLYQCGKQIIKYITHDKSFDFNKYFEQVKLYTQDGDNKIKPKLINKEENVKGMKYTFTIPPGYGIDSLLKYKDGVEAVLGFRTDFVIEGKNWVIQVLEKSLPKTIEYKIPVEDKKGIIIPIGEDLEGVININLVKDPNTFIVGTTGSGKSVCTKQIIVSLVNMYSPKELELYLCDLKRVELNLFRNLEHTKEFKYTVYDVTQVILDILEECNRRYDLFMKYNVTNIFEYNKIFQRSKLPFKILFIEEIVNLLQDKKNVGMNALKQLVSICRASGIYCFISTQRPSSDVIDNVVKANINNRICFKVEDVKNSVICIDDEGAEQLRGEGHGILKIGSSKKEFQGYYITDDEVKKLIKPFIRKEEVKTTSRQIGFVENKKEEQSEFSKYEKVVQDLNVDIDLSFLDKL